MIKLLRVMVLVIILNIIPLIYLAFATSHYDELTVKITYPFEGDIVLNSPMPVYGVVSDPLAEVDINGTPVVIAENGYFQGSVDLIEGENKINIAAENQELENTITTISVNYSPK